MKTLEKEDINKKFAEIAKKELDKKYERVWKYLSETIGDSKKARRVYNWIIRYTYFK